MSNARHEVAKDEGIFPPLHIPGVDFIQLVVPNPQFTAHRADEIQPQTTTDGIAYGDSADASETSGGHRGHERELIFENKVSGKGEQRFIGNWQSHNAKHEEEEQGGIAILWDLV